jgi:hypothetical protein
MNRHHLILLSLFLLTGLTANAQNASAQNAGTQKNWQLRKDQDSIRVYGRSNANSPCDDLKVETTLSGKLSSLAALLLDIDNYPNWSFNNEKASVLKKIGPSELYFYSLIHSPWPASDRDLAIHLHILQDSATRELSVSADEIANYIPEKKGIVRVPLSAERWTVTPAPGDKLKISYELRLDPGASAPAWLLNMFATKGPYETFLHLREQLKRPKYRDALLPFIRN